MSQKSEVFEERIRGLELSNKQHLKANRMHKIITVAAFAVIIAIARIPAPSATSAGPKIFSSQQFVLVNSSGATLATLGAGPQGGAVLTYYDPNGKRIMGVGAWDDNTGDGLIEYDGNSIVAGNGRFRASFGMSGHGNPTPGVGGLVWGPEGNKRLDFGALLDGTSPGFASFDKNGVRRTGTGSDPNGAGFYVFDSNGALRSGVDIDQANNFAGAFANDAAGTNRAFSGVALDGSSSFEGIRDAAGGLEVSQYASSDGSVSAANLQDVNGTYRVQDYQVGATAGVVVRDSNNNVTGTLP